jgi:hypothetical protein
MKCQQRKNFKRRARQITHAEHGLGEESAKISRASRGTAQRFSAHQHKRADYFPLAGMKIATGGVIL